VKEFPAAFAACGVLAVAGQDVRGVPFAGRRQLLEELAREWAAPPALSPTPHEGLNRYTGKRVPLPYNRYARQGTLPYHSVSGNTALSDGP
jgi:hypothetical protein